MVIPVGNKHAQDLIKVRKSKQDIRATDLGGCRFVKLVGEHGWKA